nr:hypothetical protein [Candidatus Dojkabacteria bacterium]
YVYLVISLISLNSVLSQETPMGDIIVKKIIANTKAQIQKTEIKDDVLNIKVVTANVTSNIIDSVIMSLVNDIIITHAGITIYSPWKRNSESKSIELGLILGNNEEMLVIEYNNSKKELILATTSFERPKQKEVNETPLSDLIIKNIINECEATIEREDSGKLSGIKSITASVASFYDETLIKAIINNVINSYPNVEIEENWKRDENQSINTILNLGTNNKEILMIGYVKKYQALQFVYQRTKH